MALTLNPIATALSGLNAAQQRLDTSAHNIANAQTPGFRRQTVTQTAQPGGGVETRIGQATETSTGTGDFGHLADDLVDQRISLYSFAANLKTLQTADRMLGTLLDREA